MIIVYESKTGFTKRYADMLSRKTGLAVYPAKDLPKINPTEEMIFLGWMKAGSIQGLSKVRKYAVKAVCVTGTGRAAEPDDRAVKARNKIQELPFFYLRGGCVPLKEIKGFDRMLMALFVKMLKGKKDKNESLTEAIANIENGFDGVREENLAPVVSWVHAR